MKKIDRKEILRTLKDQAGRSGVVKVNNALVALIVGCSERSVGNALRDLEADGLIHRETRYKKIEGIVYALRYIVLTDPDYKYRGFTIEEHKNLSKKRNHRAVPYDGGKTWEWWRCPSGMCDSSKRHVHAKYPHEEINKNPYLWEVVAIDKEFFGPTHVWEFANHAIAKHKKMAKGFYKEEYEL